MSTALSRLGAFAAQLDYDRLPPAVVDRACLVLLDTVAAIVAGLDAPEIEAVEAWARANGEGAALRALVFGSAGVLHELDEGFAAARGHPAIHVIPAALAYAASAHRNGRDAITAIVAGYEVAARVGAAVTLAPGMHPHGTWGVLGAAAAVGRLGGLSPMQMQSALEIAACLPMATSYQALRDGSPVRHVWTGMANFNGSMAASLATAAFVPPTSGAMNSLSSIMGTSFSEEIATAGLGERWDIMRGYFKVHACCRHGHATLDAIDEALRDQAIKPEDVVAVRVRTYANAVQAMTPNLPVTSVLAARFSLPFMVSARIVRGETGPDLFTPQVPFAADIQAFMQRVEVVEDPELTARGAASRGARVEIELADGRTLSGEVSHSRGDPARPLERDAIVEKFRRLVRPRLGEERGRRLEEAILSLPEQHDCAGIVAMISADRNEKQA